MKKTYRKPEIAVEDFLLNQFIAVSCNEKINHSDTACWTPNDQSNWAVSGFIQELIANGFFSENVACRIDADADTTDGICYHTQGNSLFNS